MRKGAWAALVFALAFQACGKNPEAQPRGKIAILMTSQGIIKIRFFQDKAPKTVANFIGLATGAKAWRDPRTGKKTTAPLYDGVIFHRVIPGFMIQTGDPLGNGQGDIGYTFADEIAPDVHYDKPGLVGMANFGPDTNASQFFITTAPAPQLDGRHTMFGEVIEGLAVAKTISQAPRDQSEGSDRPLEPVVLRSVKIVEGP